MHSTQETERARLMAQWRTTGGAGPRTVEETPAGDDGLKAGPTFPGYGPYCADDGLQAAFSNQFAMPGCRIDDGLQAAFSNQFAMPGCRVDDGLSAAFTVASGGGICGDDGLTASMLTRRLCIEGETPAGDDGLEAGRHTVRGYTCVTADDGLSAGPFSYPAYCGNSADDGQRPSMTWRAPMGACADDGLAAQGSSFRRGDCFIDDDLTA